MHTNKTVECDACAPPRLFKYQKNLLRAYIMEPDNLGGIIPPRKRIHYIAPRGDWLGSKLGGRINHPHKLIGLSVFYMADCGRTVGS